MQQVTNEICKNWILRHATIVHSKSVKELEYLQNKIVVVRNGKIVAIRNEETDSAVHEIFNTVFVNDPRDSVKEITLTSSQILIPGFVDTHAHAPQFAFVGTGLDLPLLEWLKKYTFPCEAKFQDEEFARKVYSKSIETHLKNGTTTICYYGTIHLKATEILATLLSDKGMRAFVGKVCMDQNAPEFYVESTEQSLTDTLEYIEFFKEQRGKSLSHLVRPILTPRFAPTCSRELMQGLSHLAEEHSTPIQTHLSENKGEVEWVKDLFPECQSYTQVYDCYGLLTRRTVLAHCVYLQDDELDLIAQRECAISHCPNSNSTLQSGMMPLRRYMERGLKLGLGTDVSGGHSPSMVDAIRSSVTVSKLLSVESANNVHFITPITMPEAFHLATCGGAEVLGLGEHIGAIKVNMDFDALILDYSHLNCWIDEESTIEEIFEKMIYLMDDRQIIHIFVEGKQLK